MAETYLRLADERVRLSSRQLPEVVDTVARAYRAFAADPGDCRGSLEIMWLGTRIGIQDETGETHRVGSTFQAWATADRLLRAKYAGWTGESHLLLHAAGVARPGGEAALLLGQEDAGKSTLACSLVARGWHFLSDEMVPLDRQARAVAFPKLPDADPETARFIAAGCPALQALTTKEAPNGYLGLPESRMLAPGASRPVRLLLFLQREESAGQPGLQPTRGGDKLMALVQSAFNSHQLGERAVWLSARLVEHAQVFRLSYRDALSQGERISEMLRSALRP